MSGVLPGFGRVRHAALGTRRPANSRVPVEKAARLKVQTNRPPLMSKMIIPVDSLQRTFYPLSTIAISRFPGAAPAIRACPRDAGSGVRPHAIDDPFQKIPPGGQEFAGRIDSMRD